MQVEERRATATKEREGESVQLEVVSNDGKTRKTKRFHFSKTVTIGLKRRGDTKSRDSISIIKRFIMELRN